MKREPKYHDVDGEGCVFMVIVICGLSGLMSCLPSRYFGNSGGQIIGLLLGIYIIHRLWKKKKNPPAEK